MGRLGGEEFVMLLLHAGLNYAEQIAQKLRLQKATTSETHRC